MKPDDNSSIEHFPLIDATDHEILMHRDAHFGGLFSIMLDYYRKEGKGAQSEFDLARIERLAALEDQLKQNLAPLFLTGNEAEKVAEARASYQKLRDIYAIQKPKTIYPRLIADLILAEEEEAEVEIAAIVAEKDKIVPALITLLRTEEMYDPLFPGYGQAPLLAVKCLGQIGDKRAIISLFEALGQSDFFADDQILKALQEIGEPARDFLLRVLKGRPLNEDNEKAAIALLAFKDQEVVADHCFELLQQPDVQKDPCLSTYLVLICVGLKDPDKRRAFAEMAKRKDLPSLLQEDMKGVMHDWEEKG
jgi:HEAT repeat protein